MCKKTIATTVKRQEREIKQQQQKFQVGQPPAIELKPGSPPIYVQPVKSPTPKSPPVKKPESPKFKVKTFQQESGYMADTDEPFQQKSSIQSVQKSFGKHESSSSMTSHTESRTSYSESRSEYFESKSYDSRQQQQQKKESFIAPPAPLITKQPVQPPVQQQRSSFVEKSYISSTSPSRFSSTKETIYTTDQSHKKLETTKKFCRPLRVLPNS